MTDRYSWTWTKIADNETGASLETGRWKVGPRWMPTFGYRRFAEAEPVGLSAKSIETAAKYLEEGRAVRGFLVAKQIVEWQLSNGANKSSESLGTVYSYAYIVALISEFLRLTGPQKPKYSMTYLVCETNVEHYNKIGEELYATIDELLNDERIKVLWSAKSK